MLKAGQEFSELQDSYMVFITQTDIFGQGIPIYTINRHFEEIDDIFDDGSLMGIMKLGAEQAMNVVGLNDSDREILQKRL